MDTNEINAIMCTDKYTREVYGGTFSIDQIPVGAITPVCYIVNTSPSWHPGTHWVAVFKAKRGSEYFCSYGSTPLPKITSLFGKTYISEGSVWSILHFVLIM